MDNGTRRTGIAGERSGDVIPALSLKHDTVPANNAVILSGAKDLLFASSSKKGVGKHELTPTSHSIAQYLNAKTWHM